MRTLFCSALAVALCLGVAVAEEKKEEAKKVEKKAGKAKGSAVHGAFKKYDAATGTLWVTVKVKKEMIDKEVKVPEASRTVVFEGESRKQGTAKDSFATAKAGTPVTVRSDADGHVVGIVIGTPPKRAKVNK